MKPISVTICKTRQPLKLRPLPRMETELKGRALIRWLKEQGAQPVDLATKRRLKATGNWGMPLE